MNRKKYIQKILRESLVNVVKKPKPVITFDGVDFNYQTSKYGRPIEVTGILVPYNSGRAWEYEVQTDEFLDQEDEIIHDEHWEEIRDEILNAYYDQL